MTSGTEGKARRVVPESELIALASGRALALVKESLDAHGVGIEARRIIVGIPAELFEVTVPDGGEVTIQRYEQ